MQHRKKTGAFSWYHVEAARWGKRFSVCVSGANFCLLPIAPHGLLSLHLKSCPSLRILFAGKLCSIMKRVRRYFHLFILLWILENKWNPNCAVSNTEVDLWRLVQSQGNHYLWTAHVWSCWDFEVSWKAFLNELSFVIQYLSIFLCLNIQLLHYLWFHKHVRCLESVAQTWQSLCAYLYNDKWFHSFPFSSIWKP